MKAEMRSKLAREPYEEKIRKVEQLIRLVKEFPRDRMEPVNKVDATPVNPPQRPNLVGRDSVEPNGLV
jgi:hypothetical protein